MSGSGLTLATGLLLVPLSAQALLSSGRPTVPCPFPPLVFPLFWGVPELLIIAIPSVFFYLWCWPCFRGKLICLQRTAIGLGCVSAASLLWFVGGWGYGVQYEGEPFTRTTALFSFLFAMGVLFLLVQSRERSSLPLRLAANFLLFAWTFTYAFPYLGELP